MRIEKYIVCILLCGISVLAAKAQPRLRTPEYFLGVHGGVSASSVLFTPRVANMTPITKAAVLGGNGGLVFRYAGHKFCAFQMELNYEHRGWAEASDAGNYNRSLHYVELPILMNLQFGGEVCRWFMNLGPQIGYCVKDEGNSGKMVNGIGAIEYDPVDHPFDWGLAVGTGLSFPTPRAGVYELEIRFDYSFGGIYGTSITDYFTMASPMDLSVNLNWLMPVRRKTKMEN